MKRERAGERRKEEREGEAPLSVARRREATELFSVAIISPFRARKREKEGEGKREERKREREREREREKTGREGKSSSLPSARTRA